MWDSLDIFVFLFLRNLTYISSNMNDAIKLFIKKRLRLWFFSHQPTKQSLFFPLLSLLLLCSPFLIAFYVSVSQISHLAWTSLLSSVSFVLSFSLNPLGVLSDEDQSLPLWVLLLLLWWIKSLSSSHEALVYICLFNKQVKLKPKFNLQTIKRAKILKFPCFLF